MLLQHVTDWMTGDARAVLPGGRMFTLTDVAPVAFFAAAGASMALLAASRRRRGLGRARTAALVARRYGLLVPLGMGLGWVFWRSPLMFGVLEALGVAVLLAAAVAAAVPDRHLPAATAAVLVAGAVSVHIAGDGSWLAREVVGGKFPIVSYTGFALAGAAVVRTGRQLDRRWVAAAAAGGLLATAALLVVGVVPARYPGDVAYAVPGLAGTAVVFGLGQLRWRPVLGAVDRVVRRAAAHTLGIFLAHYLLYGALRRHGLLGTFSGAAAVAAAVSVTVAMCLVAPRVPPLPWSPRTGRPRRAARVLGASAPARTARPGPAPPAPARP
jgi:hypothetical protein